jgi:virginiamycin B lyase
MQHKSGAALALAAAFMLSACAGGSTPALPGAAPVSSGPSHTKRKVKATIRITIPKRKHHRRIRVHGHYISPATASIAIAITPVGGSPTNDNANLTVASNPNCTQSLVSPLICTLTITLAPGSYTATFATYDGPLSGTGGVNDAPTGNELSANQSATLDIVAGQANNLDIALDGIPVSVALIPAANSRMSGNTANGFVAPKCGSAGPVSENVSVLGADADGNYIVGPGAPSPSLATANSATMAVSTPSPSSPNVFTITHPVSNTVQAATQLTATVTTAPDAGGGAQTAHVPVSVAGGTNICGLFASYALPLGGQQTPTAITLGPDGNMWFTAGCGGNIGKVTSDGTITEYRAKASGGTFPQGITVLGNNLWFADQFNAIGEMTTDGVLVNSYPATGGGAGTGPNAIAAGPDGKLWFGQIAVQDNVSNMTTAGVQTDFPLGFNGGLTNGVVAGPDNRMWFTENYIGGSIVRVTTTGTVQEYTTGLTGSPQGITVGPDNNLWFTETNGLNPGFVSNITTNGVITEFALPGSNSSPHGITAGGDGNLWFVESNVNKIASSTTAGLITEFQDPTGAGLTGIAKGTDGSLWFTECYTNSIGHLQ